MEHKTESHEIEVDNVDLLKKQNKELRELCEKLLEEIHSNTYEYNPNGADYCRFCIGYKNRSGYEHESHCITLTKIPEE